MSNESEGTRTEHRFRGPAGRLHLPAWRKDCWRGRPAGCCWLCSLRLVRAALPG